MFNFLDNINNFKNFCSFKDHIKFLGLNKDLYKELNNEMTHNHDDLYLDALLKTIEVY